MRGNCVIAQSGGPTAVINASACGVIHEAMRHREIKDIYGAHNGIIGILQRRLFDLRKEDPSTLRLLCLTPSSALGTCRYKLTSDKELETTVQVFREYDIRYFFYIGGNDSQDTANRINELAITQGYALKVIGIPKTVDNDLDFTDHCPGYGSVIKYLATLTLETGLDTEASCTSDPVNVIESIGRNAGWIAAGSALAKREEYDAPHIILFPEVAFDVDKLKDRLEHYLSKIGRAVIVVSEGLRTSDGSYVAQQKGNFSKDAFGHTQLGGSSSFIREVVESEFHVKSRCCNPSIILRNGMHCASFVDHHEAMLVGKMAVRLAISGISGKMVTLVRQSNDPYKCGTGMVDLGEVSNQEKLLPRDWISTDGLFVENNFIKYAKPLIQGEVKPVMDSGLPHFARLKKHFIPEKRARVQVGAF